jgi:Mrp family chromosome partitioning ATPase
MAASRALEDVIDKLAQQFDHLLFDLPPVLASSDAVTLAQLAEGVVLVVQQGVTSTTQVDAALAELSGRDILGVLLNRADSSIPPRLRKMLGG